MNIRYDSQKYFQYKTPADELIIEPEQPRIFCKDPDKIIFAHAQTKTGFSHVVSEPVEFAPDRRSDFKLDIVKSFDSLCAVFFHTAKGQKIFYSFAQNGAVIQRSPSPYLDLTKLIDPSGTFSVTAESDLFSVTQDSIVLNRHKQIV